MDMKQEFLGNNLCSIMASAVPEPPIKVEENKVVEVISAQNIVEGIINSIAYHKLNIKQEEFDPEDVLLPARSTTENIVGERLLCKLSGCKAEDESNIAKHKITYEKQFHLCSVASAVTEPPIKVEENKVVDGVNVQKIVDGTINNIAYHKLHIKQEEFDLEDVLLPARSMSENIGGERLVCKLSECKAEESNFAKHKITHQKQSNLCSYCEYKTPKKAYLVEHMRTHTGEKPFCCSFCDYKAATKHTLSTHMKLHTGEKPYSCSLCEYRAVQKQKLVFHMSRHTGEKPYSCSLCKYKAVGKQSLVIHMRKHTGEKPYACTFCEYRAVMKQTLVIHMRTHTGEKPYSCSFCDYKAVVKHKLVIHTRTHTGEKPYSCSFCEYKAARKQELVKHVKRHTGDKPYSCTICEYKAIDKYNVVIHMRKHTGEKPYTCTVCEYKAVTKDNLVNHLKVHTEEIT